MRLLFRIIIGILAVIAAICLSVEACGAIYSVTHDPQHRDMGQIASANWQQAVDKVTALVSKSSGAAKADDAPAEVSAPIADATPPPPPAPTWTAPTVIPPVPGGTLTTPTAIYTNAQIVMVEADRVTIMSDNGRTIVPMWQLPSTLQKQLNYNPKAALEASTQQRPEEAPPIRR